MNKKIYLLLTVLLAWSFNLKAQTAQIESLTANPGSVVSFDITVGGLPANVGAVSMFIGYDPNVLTYVGSTLVDADFDGYIANDMGGAGMVGIQWTNPDGAQLNDVLLSLEFQYSTLGGSCDVTFGPGCEFALTDLSSVEVSYINGGIGPNAGFPTVTIDELVEEAGPVTLGITGANFTETAGALELHIGFDESMMQYVSYTTTLDYPDQLFVNLESPGVLGVSYTNTNGDELNEEFLTLTFNYDGTGITELIFLDGTEIANTSATVIGVSYDNGKITPDPTDYNLWIENKTGVPGNEVAIEVYAGGFDVDYVMGAVTLNIGYNPAHMTFIGVTDANLAGVYANASTPGLISIMWSNFDPGFFPFDGTLFSLNFDYHFGSSAVTFEGGCEVSDINLEFIPTTYTDGSITFLAGGPEVSLPSITGVIGQAISFPVTANNFGLYEPAAVSLFIGYNSSVLTFTGITEDGILSGIFANEMPGSQIGIQWFDINGIPVADNDVLFTLNFIYNGGVCDMTFNAGCEFADAMLTVIPVAYYDGAVITGSYFDINVFLEGPFNGATMNTYLNDFDLIPLSHPYSGTPWSYNGAESVGAIPANVVDWVLLEVRETAGGVESATAATMVAQQACFLLNDGSVVGLDGSSNVLFPMSFNDNVYIVVYHRNHVRIMSADALTQVGGVYTYDFTDDDAKAYGSYQKSLGSVYGMFAGDIDNDGEVFSIDLDLILLDYPSFDVYLNSDLDLDGEVFSIDLDVILYNYPLFTSIP